MASDAMDDRYPELLRSNGVDQELPSFLTKKISPPAVKGGSGVKSLHSTSANIPDRQGLIFI
jgi:hypothetical protein